MQALHDLRHKLCNELKEYGNVELSMGSLDVIDKLAHAIKNIDKVIAASEDGGHSYKRDSMGRYSRDHQMIADLRNLQDKAMDDATKQLYERMINMIETM